MQSLKIQQYGYLLVGIFIGIVITSVLWYGTTNQTIQDKYDLISDIQKPENQKYEVYYNLFLKTQPEFDNFLNNEFNFPEKIHFVVKECGGPEITGYYREPNLIQICYKDIEWIDQKASEQEPFVGKSGVSQLRSGTIVFITFHETAHALIDVFKIPITGNEEITADNFATILLLQLMIQDNSKSYYLSAPMEFFASEMDQYDEISDLPFWKKHPLGEERANEILCLAYGKLGPEPFPPQIVEKLIPSPKRLDQCSDDFHIISDSWKRLLHNPLKPDSALRAIFD